MASYWYAFWYFLSIICILVIQAGGLGIRVQHKSKIFPEPEWSVFLTIVAAGIIFNAAICGVLSDPDAARYQTRVAWIPVLILAVMIAKSYWTAPDAKLVDIVKREADKIGATTKEYVFDVCRAQPKAIQSRIERAGEEANVKED